MGNNMRNLVFIHRALIKYSVTWCSPCGTLVDRFDNWIFH